MMQEQEFPILNKPSGGIRSALLISQALNLAFAVLPAVYLGEIR